MPLSCTLTRDGEQVPPDPINPGWSEIDLDFCMAKAAEEQELPHTWTARDLVLPHTFALPHRIDYHAGACIIKPGDVFYAWRGAR